MEIDYVGKLLVYLQATPLVWIRILLVLYNQNYCIHAHAFDYIKKGDIRIYGRGGILEI